MFLDAYFVLYFILFSEEKDEEFKYFAGKYEEVDARLNKSYDLVLRDLFLLENQISLSVIKVLMKSLKSDEKEISNFIVDFSHQLLMPRLAHFTRSSNQTKKEQINLDESPHLLHLVRENLIPRELDDIKIKHEMLPARFGRISDFIVDFSQRLMPRLANFMGSSYQTEEQILNLEQSPHLLHLVRENLISPSFARRINFRESYRSVTDLVSAGIYFKPSKTRNLTDVKFQSWPCFGILTLPSIKVDHLTIPLLLNLVAYEMCPHESPETRIASYICLMDSLIDEADDVKELRKKRILVNKLGSDDHLAQLFNEIAIELVAYVNYNPRAYVQAKLMIDEHCKSIRHIWMAEWVHKYFSSPWTLMAFLGALLALALTMTQTIFSAYPRST